MCCAASTFAADGENPVELFDQLDVNKDGQVTIDEVPEEHRPHLERLLRKGDQDENKSLSRDEWAAAHTPDPAPEAGAGPAGREGQPNPGQLFERMDANKDGKLQKSEIPEGAPQPIRDMLNKAFEKAGQDEISREDLLKSLGESMKGKGKPKGKGGDPRQMVERLKKLDKNGDGKITADEFPAEGGERVKALLERLGGGDSIDLAKAEEHAQKQAAKMDKKGSGGQGPKKKKKPGEGGEPSDDDRRPEEGRPGGGPPEEDHRDPDREGRGPHGDGPHMRDEGHGPEGRGAGREGHRPGDHGPYDHDSEGHGPPGGFMGLLDENHDGRLSREEFSRAATYFGDLDQNHDGSLDPRELMGPPPRGDRGPRDGGPEGRPRPDGEDGPDGERMRDGDRPRPGAGGPRPAGEGRGPNAEGDRPRPEGGPGFGRPNPQEFLKQFDKDGDGFISQDEAPGPMKEHFDEIDADKDGKLTQAEVRTHMERRFGGRGPGRGGPAGRDGRPGGAGPDGPRPERPAAEDEKPAEDKPAEEKPAESSKV